MVAPAGESQAFQHGSMAGTTGETRIDLGVLQPGRLDYSCGMGMYSGIVTIS